MATADERIVVAREMLNQARKLVAEGVDDGLNHEQILGLNSTTSTILLLSVAESNLAIATILNNRS